MNRTILKVLVADVILVVACFYVIQDIQWRGFYAASVHGACPQTCAYSPSFAYNFLVQYFTMSGNSARLSSPATLDWVQILAYVLVVLNVFYAYKSLKPRIQQPGSEPAEAIVHSVQ